MENLLYKPNTKKVENLLNIRFSLKDAGISWLHQEKPKHKKIIPYINKIVFYPFERFSVSVYPNNPHES